MEHPVHEIPGVIATLVQGTSADQQRALADYFLPSAYFVHPFCRVPSFDDTPVPLTSYVVNSRHLLWFIYQWYRILSPRIEFSVDSAVYDQRQRLLYCTIRQVFTLWFVPLRLWRADVRLVTVLRLEPRLVSPEDGRSPMPAGVTETEREADPEGRDPVLGQRPTRLYIAGQEDLYQVGEFLKFISAPFGLALVWYAWQLFATVLCVLGTVAFWPVNMARDRMVSDGAGAVGKRK